MGCDELAALRKGCFRYVGRLASPISKLLTTTMESSVESIQYVLEDLFGESISPITLEMLSNAAVPLEYRQTVSLIVDKLMFYVADLQAIAADQATMETVSGV